VWPDSTRFEYCDRKPDLEARQQAFSLFTRISEPLHEVGQRDELTDVPHLRFAPQAQGIFVDWYKTWMNTRQANIETEALENHLSKYPALLGKLSLILSVCDEPAATSISVYSLAKKDSPGSSTLSHTQGGPTTLQRRQKQMPPIVYLEDLKEVSCLTCSQPETFIGEIGAVWGKA